MENNNNNVIEEITENVETTPTEETVEEIDQVETQSAETQSEKIYSEAEYQAKFEEAMNKKMPRREAKIRKTVEDEYSQHKKLVSILQAGTGEKDIGKLADAFEQHYRSKGIDTTSKQLEYSEKDTAVLARADAEEIIASGFDEVVEETDRLAKIGIKNMTAREKAMFQVLAEHRQNTERSKEFADLGVTEDVYNSTEFKNFASMFKADTPIKEILSIYNKTAQPKKEIQTMGSMKNSKADNSAVKDYYSPEEAKKFTRADYDKTPGLLEAVENSMRKWKK